MVVLDTQLMETNTAMRDELLHKSGLNDMGWESDLESACRL